MTTEYKQTSVGKIPKEWKIVKLGDICSKITDGTHKTPRYVERGIPFLSTQNIVPFRKGFDFSNYKRYISFEEHKELIKRCKPEKGDILISKCGTIGRAKLVDVDYDFSIFVGLALLKLKKDLVSGEYLEQLLNYEPIRRHMEVLSPGSTRRTLTINVIEKIKIPLPPLPEQHRIAEVLSCVDDAIRRVDLAIAKTERLKKGLMQKLLTEGIGHKEFKETKIGKIPKTWKIARLEEITKIIMGQSPPGNTYNESGDGTPLINGPTEFGEKYPKKIKWTTNPTKISKKHDILICVRGHTTGRLNMSDGVYCIGRGVAAIRSIETKIYSMFVYYVLEKYRNKIYQQSYAAGSTFPNITRVRLGKFLIPLPPLLEQKKIASILSTIDKKFDLEKKRKERLVRIKRGLMGDLLTGRRRVKVAM